MGNGSLRHSKRTLLTHLTLFFTMRSQRAPHESGHRQGRNPLRCRNAPQCGEGADVSGTCGVCFAVVCAVNPLD